MTFRTWLMVGWGVLLLLGAAMIFNHSRPDPAGLVQHATFPPTRCCKVATSALFPPACNI